MKKNCEILILGSFPSEKSLTENKYYNNPKNPFWEIISFVFEKNIKKFDNYEDKVKFLKKP